MENNDQPEFHSILKTMFKGFGRDTPDKDVVQLWWNVFQGDDMNDVRSAFGQAISESTNFLVPGVVRKYIPDRSGFLGAEEAWNHYPKTERDGSWVYKEMMQAASACADSIDRGDLIGARKAFLEAYTPIVANAKKSGKRPSWFYSAGCGMTRVEADQQIIQKTIEASEKQWIPIEKAQSVLLIADQSAPNPEILKMLESAIKQMPDGSVKTVTHNSSPVKQI